jgi:HEXXH motif-containing protein
MGLSTAPTQFDYGFRVADALVHEASHQYANLVSLAFPLSNGTDSKLYYSALARRERPIDRVLFAFHAAGNIALFYADALKGGRSECAYNYKWAVECANSLREPIEQTTGLTDVGLGVYRPLAAALDRMDPGLLANA